MLADGAVQVPTLPPSSFQTTTVAERGRPPAASGHFENASGSTSGATSGLFGWLPYSPGCCTFTKTYFWSGVNVMPVISQPEGPTRKRRISRVDGSATSI